jgi:hypothetical protein
MPTAFGCAECQHPGDSRRQSRQRMHDERQEEGKSKAIDHTVVPFIALSSLPPVAVWKLSINAKGSLFVAYSGKGSIPLPRSPCTREYRDGADDGEVKFHLIWV